MEKPRLPHQRRRQKTFFIRLAVKMNMDEQLVIARWQELLNLVLTPLTPAFGDREGRPEDR